MSESSAPSVSCGSAPSVELREVSGAPPRPATVKRLAESTLPTEYGDFRLIVYDVVDSEAHPSLSREYLALVVGDVTGAENLPVRLHSECLTGETFGSLKCDCREQLALAQRYVQDQGRGCVLYLRQEGRGIGLTNKVRAYALQAQGADTIEANRRLNLPVDARRYDAAERILEDLGIKSVRLMTNNPDKLHGLTGVRVQTVGRIPLEVPPSEHSRDYLEVKRSRMGHLLSK
jgi:3,4-dihydroxy 2-butanone 4-phosphate synthase/GTP cyclohydrolase II